MQAFQCLVPGLLIAALPHPQSRPLHLLEMIGNSPDDHTKASCGTCFDKATHVSNPMLWIVVCDPMPRISTPAWDSPNSCSCSAKWAWDHLGCVCHTPLLQCWNRGFKEQANVGAHETCVQVHSMTLKDGSVAPSVPSSQSNAHFAEREQEFGKFQAGVEIRGMGSQTKIPGMGFEL